VEAVAVGEWYWRCRAYRVWPGSYRALVSAIAGEMGGPGWLEAGMTDDA
jgi:hypothetical protein